MPEDQADINKGICPYCGNDVVPTMRKVLFDPWSRVCAIANVGDANSVNITGYHIPFQDGFHCASCKLHFDEMPPAFLSTKPIPIALRDAPKDPLPSFRPPFVRPRPAWVDDSHGAFPPTVRGSNTLSGFFDF